MPATPEGTKEMMRFSIGRFETPHTVGELRRIFDQLNTKTRDMIEKRGKQFSTIGQILEALQWGDTQQLPSHLIAEMNALLQMIALEDKMEAADQERKLGARVSQVAKAAPRSVRNLFGLIGTAQVVTQ